MRPYGVKAVRSFFVFGKTRYSSGEYMILFGMYGETILPFGRMNHDPFNHLAVENGVCICYHNTREVATTQNPER